MGHRRTLPGRRAGQRALESLGLDWLIHPAILYAGVALGAIGVFFSLPRRGGAPQILGGLLAAIAFGGVVLAVTIRGLATGEGAPNLFFYVFGFTALLGSWRVITHQRPVYAALWFIVTILSTAALFLLLHAEFMTFALVIIYAGAILITYLFVIMLATQAPTEERVETLRMYDLEAREPLVTTIVGFGLLAVLTGMLAGGTPTLGGSPEHYDPDAILSELPRKVQRAYDQVGLGELALPLAPAAGVQGDATAERSLYYVGDGGGGRAVLKIRDIEAFNVRLRASLGEPETAAEPLPPEAVALIPEDLREMGAIAAGPGEPGLLRVNFPESLRGENIEWVGFALLGQHPLAIEIAGVILLLALVGAVILARKQSAIVEASQLAQARTLGRAGGAA